jgi:hypothetical protein
MEEIRLGVYHPSPVMAIQKRGKGDEKKMKRLDLPQHRLMTVGCHPSALIVRCATARELPVR